MGLENGITIYGRTRAGKAYLAHKWTKNHESYDEIGEYDFAYLRKYWGLRNEIISAMGFSEEGGSFEIDVNGLKDILKIYTEFLNPEIFDAHSCLWEYHIAVKNLSQGIYEMTEILADIEAKIVNAEDLEIRFYDSY